MSTVALTSFIFHYQKFAAALDSFDNTGVFEHSDKQKTWDYLSLGGSDETIQATLLNVNGWDSSRTDSPIHALFRYKLLDILANVTGCEKHPERKLQSQSAVTLPTRVDQVSLTCLCIELLGYNGLFVAPPFIV
jgi:hypothetical protein